MTEAVLHNDAKSEWLSVCSSLRESLGDSAYKSWLQPLGAGKIEQGCAKLFAPTRFMRDWVEKHYLSSIKTAWQKHNPEVTSVDMEVNAYCALDGSFAAPSAPSASSVPSAPTFSDSAYDAVKEVPFAASDSLKDIKEVAQSFTLPAAEAKDFSDVAAPLDSRFTFDNFVVGKSNEFAYLAARKVAESREVSFKPLFLHSGVGLGKTHLMQAIANHIKKTDPTRSVMYLSAEKFMYKFISALRSHETISFKEKFRSVDVLMVDDLQFIAGKDATQEEFFHTFNELMNAGAQIVLSADKPPAELKGFEARLQSRFAAGLEVDIHPATFELRVGILESKAAKAGVILPKEVIEFLAEHISSNIRELEGAFNRLVAHSELMNAPITLENTKVILKDILLSSEKVVSLDDIRDKTAAHFNVKVADLRGVRRQREIARPRQVAMYLSKTLTTRSLPDIGRVFDRDHTTVMHAVKTIESLLKTDKNLAEDIRIITRSLGC